MTCLGLNYFADSLTSYNLSNGFQSLLSTSALNQTADFLKEYQLSGNIERYDFANRLLNNDYYIAKSGPDICTSGLTFSATVGNDTFTGTNCDDTVLYDLDAGWADNGDTDVIYLYGGDDLVTSNDAFSLGLNSIIDTGSGNDTIESTADDIAMRFNAQIIMGDGDDHFNLDTNIAFFYELDMYDNSLIDTGAGNDIVDGGYFFFMDDSAAVTTGSGNDTVNGGEISLSSAATLNTGIGNDVINSSNYIYIGGTSEIDMGSGDDTINVVNGIYLDDNSNLYTGDGNDSINLTTFGLYMRDFYSVLDMGAGNDTFTNADEIFFEAGSQLLMGAGDDVLDVAGDIGGTGDVRMGSGNDTIILNGSGNKSGLYGGADADLFLFTGIGGTVQIDDFSVGENDVLDISQILVGYDPMINLLSDFVRFTDLGADLLIEVDTDGGADSFVALATIIGGAGLDANTLETNGNLDTVI